MDTQFTNESKPWNKAKPFHRINSRNFKLNEPFADGLGYKCGCRNPATDYSQTGLADIIGKGIVEALGSLIPPLVKQIADGVLKATAGTDLEEIKKQVANFIAQKGEGFIFAQALRSIPAWVPVGRKGRDKNFKEEEKEVEGRLSRSFQACTDLPLLPWNDFYSWNFHVSVPDGNGYEYVKGRGNRLDEDEMSDLGGALGTGPTREAFAMLVNDGPKENSFECVWDTGAFSRAPGNHAKRTGDDGGSFLPGVMFHPKWPFWPMTNDHFWAQGRWVYDCTHVGEDRGTDPDTGKKTDLMWTMFRPCRAFAGYRYEGFKFDENEKAVPAARFLFFSTRRGGYVDLPPFSRLQGKDDPQFIVDLPPSPRPEPVTWPIGHAPRFAMNTLVIRPRLLMKVEFAPFGIPTSFFPDDVASFGKLDPKIEPIKSNDKIEVPDQVKITLPISQLPENTDAYGVVVSLGWADPTGELASHVKKVTLTLDNLNHLDKNGALRFKIGFNGHWVFAPAKDPPNHQIPLNASFTLLVPDDGKIGLSVHGTQRHGYGEFMEEKTDKERQLRVGGLIDLGPEFDKLIKEGKDVILDLDGKTVHLTPQFVKDLLNSKDKLFGARRDVNWQNDVDQDDKEVASAVAREMFLQPFPLINKKDQPLGLVDAKDFAFETERLASGESGLFLSEYVADSMKDLLEEFKKTGKKSRVVTLLTHQTNVVGDAHMLGFISEAGDDAQDFFHAKDYAIQFSISVAEQ